MATFTPSYRWHDYVKSVEECRKRWRTPLHYQITAFDFAAFFYDLKRGESPFTRDRSGRTVLCLVLDVFEAIATSCISTSFPVDCLALSLDRAQKSTFTHDYEAVYSSLNDHLQWDLPDLGLDRICDRVPGKFSAMNFPIYRHKVLPSSITRSGEKEKSLWQKVNNGNRLNDSGYMEEQEKIAAAFRNARLEFRKTLSDKDNQKRNDKGSISNIEAVFNRSMDAMVENVMVTPTTRGARSRMDELTSRLTGLLRVIDTLSDSSDLLSQTLNRRRNINVALLKCHRLEHRASHGAKIRSVDDVDSILLPNLDSPYLYLSLLKFLTKEYPFSSSGTIWHFKSLLHMRFLVNTVRKRKLRGSFILEFLKKVLSSIYYYLILIDPSQLQIRDHKTLQHLLHMCVTLNCPELFLVLMIHCPSNAIPSYKDEDIYDWTEFFKLAFHFENTKKAHCITNFFNPHLLSKIQNYIAKKIFKEEWTASRNLVPSTSSDQYEHLRLVSAKKLEELMGDQKSSGLQKILACIVWI